MIHHASPRRLIQSLSTVLSIAAVAGFSKWATAAEPPQSTDERLVVELFAEHPEIVTPTGIAVDAAGRIFVAESHTHFRPDNYDGPAADRILVFEDTNGDGRAGRRSVFHEGFTHVMDIEFHHDGALFVATRMDIHRLEDTDSDGLADKTISIVRMETAGTYPHNGLSGLAFDFAGDLNFGLGENLGAAYTLIGSDGTRISGGGEGGSTYHVHADGTNLRRVSTGWWNPFGMCVDAFGRTFGTDNDPGSSPPCRLIQVWEGADYGYEYRYGRTGLHPLVSWTGDIPGTLPMIAGTGEAPCAIVAYESDALPADYLGHLLVPSWADHRVEHYPLQQPANSGLVTTGRQVLVDGPDAFRPVGVALAPDGTVFVSDWVSSSYQLHKQGRIWRIRPKVVPQQLRPKASQRALASKHRPLRESAARTLSATPEGRRHLRERALTDVDPRVRSAALQALIAVKDSETDYDAVAGNDIEAALRVLAVRHLIASEESPPRWLTDKQPAAVRAEAALHLHVADHNRLLLGVLDSSDPLIQHAGVQTLSKQTSSTAFDAIRERNPRAALIAMRRSHEARHYAEQGVPAQFLNGTDADVRFLAVKWIADEKLSEHRGRLEQLLDGDELDFRLFQAICAALDRLDGKEPSDQPSPQLLLNKILDDRAPAAIRCLSLRLIDPAFERLKVEQLVRLIDHSDAELQLEAVRTLSEHPDDARFKRLEELALDFDAPSNLRATAVAAFAPVAESHAAFLLRLAGDQDRAVRGEALRGLVGVRLANGPRNSLHQLMQADPQSFEEVRRVLDGKPTAERPAATDVSAWMTLIGETGDPHIGERIFFASKVGTCSRCHQIDGRGRAVGPDLTHIHRRLAAQGDHARRWLLETLLQPSQDMAPQYTPWTIVTTDGQTLIGLPRRKGGDSEAYLGVDGREFSLKLEQIEFHRESQKSVMPDDLLNPLTTQELRDLFAFLTSPR